MAYEYIAELIIGIVLIAIGVKLDMDSPIANLVRLGLIIIGIVVLVLGIFGLFAQIP
jgi:hypothetical protein